MSKKSKACDISSKVRAEVVDRDGGRCIICGDRQIQIAHFVPRARGGLGIPQNLACMCYICHFQFDNGSYRKEIGKAFEGYLKERYPDWDKEKLIYTKWS